MLLLKVEGPIHAMRRAAAANTTQPTARKLMEMHRRLTQMFQTALTLMVACSQQTGIPDSPPTRRSIQRASLASMPGAPYGSVFSEITIFGKPPAPNTTTHMINRNIRP